MKKLNLRQILDKAKQEAHLVEQKIELLVGSTEHKVTIIIDHFCDTLLKGEEYVSIAAADLENPIIKLMLDSFGASSYVTGVVQILNRVGVALKGISGDKTLFNGAIHHLAAEILVYVKDGKVTVEEAIDRIQKLFLPIDETKIK